MKKQIQKKVAQTTLVNFILDKSGSMESVKTATISGFNEYVNTLKKDGNRYSFTVTLFDTKIQNPYKDVDLKKVPQLTAEDYNPDGSTALYDAVCTTIKGVTEKKNQKVINIIMTDGEENSSKEYTQDEMRSMIKEREAKGNWTFVFLGANQDSYLAAQKFGIPQMNTSNYSSTTDGVRCAMNTIASNTSSFAMSSTTGTSAFFSQSDQSSMGTTSGSAGYQVIDEAGSIDDKKISQHFSQLGKKSWEARKKNILD